MAPKGSKKVPIAGHGAKGEFTLNQGVFSDGTQLPCQCIYSRKTKRSLPNNLHQLPPLSDVTQTAKSFSTKKSKIRYIKRVLVPAFALQRIYYGIGANAWGLAFFDAHTSNDFDDSTLIIFENNFIKIAFVPSCYTGDLQIIDMAFFFFLQYFQKCVH